MHELELQKQDSIEERLDSLDNEEEGRWVTMRGRHVFIKKGQSPKEALNESLKKSPSKTNEKKSVEIDQEAIKKMDAKYKKEGYNGSQFIDEDKFNKELEFLKKNKEVKTEKVGGVYIIYSRNKKNDDPEHQKGILEHNIQLYKKTLQEHDERARHSFGGPLSREDQRKRDKYRNELAKKLKDAKEKLRSL